MGGLHHQPPGHLRLADSDSPCEVGTCEILGHVTYVRPVCSPHPRLPHPSSPCEVFVKHTTFVRHVTQWAKGMSHAHGAGDVVDGLHNRPPGHPRLAHLGSSCEVFVKY